MFECLVLCCVCVTCDQRLRESPDRQRAKLADRRGILKRFFLRKELSGGAVGERPYYLKPKQGGPVCCADQSTDTTVAGTTTHSAQCGQSAVICIFRDLLKLWQKWQSHFLFKIAYPPLLSIYVCIKYSNNTAFLKLCGSPCARARGGALCGGHVLVKC